MYIQKKNQNSPKKKKKKNNKLIQWTKETKNDVHQLTIKLTKEQIGKQK